MNEVLEKGQKLLDKHLKALEEASSLTKKDKALKLLSQADRLMRSEKGVAYIYEQIDRIVAAGVFADTAWEKTDQLVPKLVAGTLKAGAPLTDYELLSELKILAISKGVFSDSGISSEEAEFFLETVIVDNLDLIYGQLNEDQRIRITPEELGKIQLVFRFILERLSVEGIKKQLAEELKLLTAQRPVFTGHIRDIIRLLSDSVKLDESDTKNRALLSYLYAVKGPTEAAFERNASEYKSFLENLSEEDLGEEAETFGKSLDSKGLVSEHHVELIKFLIKGDHKKFLNLSLALNKIGKAEIDAHRTFVYQLINEHFEHYYSQAVYGLSSMLNRSLLSRPAVKNALEHLCQMKLHPTISKRLVKTAATKATNADALKLLIGGTLNTLGQPLGVGQGMNPTCQSARGISLWSDHAPAKLINMIISVAASNNLEMRFEGDIIASKDILDGLTQEFDYKMDPLSVVLVPHLDKIYNEMMKRASMRTDDPHKWVNPAFYGHWIPTGFSSAYSYIMLSIHQYDNFTACFFAAFHPDYNENRKVAYPIPIGLFITSSKAEMLGFHAVSLLRVAKDEEGVVRIYFLNPNNEGRQDWGQEIIPSVHGKGEEAGESSLPFEEFASRVYAYHYIPTGIEERMKKVPKKLLEKVKKLAEESWGKKYIWT
ncbi:MAG: hypothetical protein WD048_05400 [Chitinophagales bacterium]